MAQRQRNFCFTLNNYNDDDINSLKTLKCKYIIIGKEIAPTTGTEHLQGYFYLSNASTLKAVIKRLKKTLGHARTHLEICKGTSEQNIDYCKKSQNFIEVGEPPEGGKRTDLAQIRDRLKSGEKPLDIIDSTDSLTFQSLRGLQILSSMYQTKRTTKPTVFWIYGSTGVGKTRLIHDTFSEIYQKDSTSWWQDYQQEKVVLIDDFRGDIKYNELLKILDRYAYRVSIKGSHGQLNSPYIIITSNRSPAETYKGCREDIGQLYRRIDKVIYMDLHKQIRDHKKK